MSKLHKSWKERLYKITGGYTKDTGNYLSGASNFQNQAIKAIENKLKDCSLGEYEKDGLKIALNIIKNLKDKNNV